MSFVGKGRKAMHMSIAMLAKRKVRSAWPIAVMQTWWLTHQIPMIRNETA